MSKGNSVKDKELPEPKPKKKKTKCKITTTKSLVSGSQNHTTLTG